MPHQEPDRPNQNTELAISDSTIKTIRAVEKRLRSMDRVTTRATKSTKGMRKEWERWDRAAKKSLGTQSKSNKGLQRLSRSMKDSTRRLRENRRELNRHVRQTRRATTATKGFLGSLRSVGALLGVGGLGFLAVRRIQSTIDKRFSLALTGGADQISLIKSLTQGRNTTSAVDLAARFQQQSPFARFELGDKSLRGLIATQKRLEPIGLDRANDLILQVTKALEPDRLRSFLQTAEGGNIERALLQSATGQNIGAVTSALNALQIADIAVKEPEKLDPLLLAATKFETTANRLADSFDKTADKIVGAAAKLSTKQLLGIGLGGAAALTIGTEAARYLIYRRLLRGVGGGGVGRPVGGVPGFGGGVGGFRPPVPRPALPSPPGEPTGGLRTIPMRPGTLPKLLNLPARGIAPTGLAAGAAAYATYGAYKSAQTAKAEREALQAQSGLQNTGLFSVAEKNRTAARNELQKVSAKIQQLEANLIAIPQGHKDVGGEDADFLTRLFLPDQPKQHKNQVNRLRKQIADLKKRKQELEDAGPSFTDKIVKSISDAAKKIKTKAGDFAKSLDDFVQKGLQANLERLQRQAAERQQLQFTAAEQASLTQLRRLEFQIARTTPLGSIGAISQLRDLQTAIQTEIGSLRKILGNIDESTHQGRLEANGIRAQVGQLRLEARQNAVQIQRAVLDSILSQAFNSSGRFSKILINRDFNLAKGLEKGILDPGLSRYVGSIGQSKGIRPVRVESLLTEIEQKVGGSRPRVTRNKRNAADAATALRNLSHAAKVAAPYLEQIEGHDTGVETARPTDRIRTNMGAE